MKLLIAIKILFTPAKKLRAIRAILEGEAHARKFPKKKKEVPA